MSMRRCMNMYTHMHMHMQLHVYMIGTFTFTCAGKCKWVHMHLCICKYMFTYWMNVSKLLLHKSNYQDKQLTTKYRSKFTCDYIWIIQSKLKSHDLQVESVFLSFKFDTIRRLLLTHRGTNLQSEQNAKHNHFDKDYVTTMWLWLFASLCHTVCQVCWWNCIRLQACTATVGCIFEIQTTCEVWKCWIKIHLSQTGATATTMTLTSFPPSQAWPKWCCDWSWKDNFVV